MKNYIIFLIFSIAILSCKSDDDTPPIEKLPPATQTGAGTFGCLINGKAFVDNSGRFNCFYQLVDGEYYFGIGGEDSVDNIAEIAIASLEKEIILNIDIPLQSRETNKFHAILDFNNLGPGLITLNNSNSKIIFTKLDQQQNIVSALFEFSVTDTTTGKVYEITEGRFDARFTQ